MPRKDKIKNNKKKANIQYLGTILIFNVNTPHCNKIIPNPEITDLLNIT